MIVAHEKQRRRINVPCPTAPPYKLFNTGHLKTGWSRPNKNGVETVENFFNDYKLATTLQVGFTLFTMTKPFLARLLVESFFPREFSLLSPIQTAGRHIVGQQLQSLLDVTCCVRPWAHPVACCYLLVGVWNRPNFLLHANGRNNSKQCWEFILANYCVRLLYSVVDCVRTHITSFSRSQLKHKLNWVFFILKS